MGWSSSFRYAFTYRYGSSMRRSRNLTAKLPPRILPDECATTPRPSICIVVAGRGCQASGRRSSQSTQRRLGSKS